MTQPLDEPPELLRVNEVARIFHVDPKTVGRWVKQGLVPFVRLPSGRLRFPAAAVQELLVVQRNPTPTPES